MRKTILAALLMFVFGSFLQAQTDQQISVQINKQKTIPKSNLTIKFAAFIEDSRCPVDTRCIQAGNAKIQIEVRKARGAAKIFELNTDARKPQTITFAGFTIKLIELKPEPATNIRINRNGYTATLAVAKTGK